jgi:hypothetical protein
LFFLVLNLRKKIHEQQYLAISNTNEYSVIYKPLLDLPTRNTGLIIDISKATSRVSLEEKFRLERRSDHYICKMSKLFIIRKIIFNQYFMVEINSCYNNTQCGQHGKCHNLVFKYKCICNFMYTGKHCENCKLEELLRAGISLIKITVIDL